MRTALVGGTLILLAVAVFTAQIPGEPQAPAKGRARTASQERSGQSTNATANGDNRKIPCKTPENASLCYWARGRLSIYNGDPSDRIWKTGTRRVLGVFNGPSHFPPRSDDDVESPELPANLDRTYESDHWRWKRSKGDAYYEFPDIFADFEVCPLEPERKGAMQAVCVESAKKIFTRSRW